MNQVPTSGKSQYFPPTPQLQPQSTSGSASLTFWSASAANFSLGRTTRHLRHFRYAIASQALCYFFLLRVNTESYPVWKIDNSFSNRHHRHRASTFFSLQRYHCPRISPIGVHPQSMPTILGSSTPLKPRPHSSHSSSWLSMRIPAH